jgi:SAM-dependent methyltransferase
MSEDGGGLYLVPQLYDVVNTPGTASEVTALVRAARLHGALWPVDRGPPKGAEPGGGIWLEPACGSGRYLRELLRRGHAVRGYDAGPRMVDYATGRLSRVTLPAVGPRPPVHPHFLLAVAGFTTPAENLRRLGPADVAFCPVNSLRHLRSDPEVLAHLEQIAGLLAPAGVYLVGMDLHHRGRAIEEDVWRGRRGRLEVTQVVQYLPPRAASRRERVIIEMMADRPRGREHHSFMYDLRTYTEQQWLALLNRSPLRRLAVCDARGRPVPPAGKRARAARLSYQIEVLTSR